MSRFARTGMRRWAAQCGASALASLAIGLGWTTTTVHAAATAAACEAMPAEVETPSGIDIAGLGSCQVVSGSASGVVNVRAVEQYYDASVGLTEWGSLGGATTGMTVAPGGSVGTGVVTTTVICYPSGFQVGTFVWLGNVTVVAGAFDSAAQVGTSQAIDMQCAGAPATPTPCVVAPMGFNEPGGNSVIAAAVGNCDESVNATHNTTTSVIIDQLTDDPLGPSSVGIGYATVQGNLVTASGTAFLPGTPDSAGGHYTATCAIVGTVGSPSTGAIPETEIEIPCGAIQ